MEDNAELGDFIAQSLPAQYRILRAADGIEGLDAAVGQGPDLIISDVLMPRMDGYTLCQTLKQDRRTNHIPVILLTAKVTLDDRLRGLTGGADDYLTKPFYVAELQLRVHNLLERQRRQRDWVRAQLNSPMTAVVPTQPAPGEPQPMGLDAEASFLEELDGHIAQHLDETQFGVEELAQVMGLSRVHLYRKVKALSGLTATEWLRNYRLKQATRLLQAGSSVSDAAYQVGFESPAYFAKCFRELYGLTPTDFQHQPPDRPI
ncbi:response regulator transcription factor [Spirosoma validum]|uniref:response regulator transcription factor n=1 Tax=Spirosoma validum TaxID=2771355 RepID=UPI00293B894E|nr:helix-turn-helix domain-containing protein [Spirosoma validum]